MYSIKLRVLKACVFLRSLQFTVALSRMIFLILDSTKLHEMLRQPFDMFRPGYADSYIMGLVNQLAQVMDEGVTDQVNSTIQFFVNMYTI